MRNNVLPTSWLVYAALPCDLLLSAECNRGEALRLQGLDSKNFTASVLLLRRHFPCDEPMYDQKSHEGKATRGKPRHLVNSYQGSPGLSTEPVLDVSIWLLHYLSSHTNALILKYYLYYFILNYFALISSFVRWGHILIWFWNYIVSGLYYLFSKEKKRQMWYSS